MWTFLVRIILRNRLVNLIIIFLLTGIMGFFALRIQLSYEYAEMLPSSDSTSIKYKEFKNQFGEDGSVLFVGIQDTGIFKLDKFNDWYDLTQQIKNTEGVKEIVSLARVFCLVKDTANRRFDFVPLVKEKPKSQSELDSIRNVVLSYPFYDGLLFNGKTGATILFVTLDKQMVNSGRRFELINSIIKYVDAFSAKYNIKAHYSGLPYIRTVLSKKIKDEMLLFIFLAMVVAALVLFFYFRSFKAMLIPIIIVAMGVIWVLGTMVLLGFKITVLSGIIPPLLIVIGVENCIFLLNKYHFEYRAHQNKVKALVRIVQRVGLATLLTNAAAAVGFAAFTITRNQMLYEFGLVASINILVVYVISLFLIPIFFSYLSPPSPRHTKHLDNKVVKGLVEKIVLTVQNRRKLIYILCIVFFLVGGFGMSMLKNEGRILDDIKKSDKLYTGLQFFESNFKGVMPLEISIDTKKKKGVMNLKMFRKIDRLQDSLSKYPELSKPLSVLEVVKFAKQAFYDGDSSYYSLPNGSEMAFMVDYIPKYDSKKKTILNNFVDSNLRITRISVQMANVKTTKIDSLRDCIQRDIDSIFDPAKYNVVITGTSIVFARGTDFLVSNLKTSIFWALLVISLLMFLLFTSPRMVLISIIPNILPQVMTAAMMGYLGIPIKPSTILIFSIALGISIDNTILYLSRFRYQIKHNASDLQDCVMAALRETGFSMIYSSSVLFLGFSIFIMSTFGGTQAVGYLIAFTLFMAMVSNLFLLPSLLLTFGKKASTKAFQKPVFEIPDEEEIVEDVDIPELRENKPPAEPDKP